MQYLTRAYNLASDRGYLDCSEVLALAAQVPTWFQSLSDPAGKVEFENRYSVRIPAALREFYECIPLACILGEAADAEVFLRTMDDPDPPPIFDWPSGPHLVFAFHVHSGLVGTVALGEEDPTVVWGFEDTGPISRVPISFSAWAFAVVDDYERQLDYWQNEYKKAMTDPNEMRRRDWIRHMPGMPRRLDGRN